TFKTTGFDTSTIQATAPDGSVVTFYVTTTYGTDQLHVDAVVNNVTAPMATGSKRVGAITTKVSTTNAGTPIPNVGMFIGGDPNATTPQKPPAMCADAGGFALSTVKSNQFGDQSATISCDLVAIAAPGNYQYWVYVG